MKGLVISFAILAIFLVIFAISLPVLSGDSNASRLAAVRTRREALRKQAIEQKASPVSLRDRLSKKTTAQKMSETVNLTKYFNVEKLRTRLSAAGWRKSDTIYKYLLAQLCLPIIMCSYLAFMIYGGPLGPKVPPEYRLLCVGGAGLIGFLLPGILLKNSITKRQKKLTRQFPDALDLLLVCVEAGLSVEQSFMRVTEEIGDTIPEIGEEFALTGAELAYLGDRRLAYDNLVLRTNNPSFKSLATMLLQSDKYGTPVADALRQISSESRKNRSNMIEKKAASLGPKMTVPMILFVLPCLFLIVIGPAVINLKF